MHSLHETALVCYTKTIELPREVYEPTKGSIHYPTIGLIFSVQYELQELQEALPNVFQRALVRDSLKGHTQFDSTADGLYTKLKYCRWFVHKAEQQQLLGLSRGDPHRASSQCFSSIDQRHIDVGQINHVPVEAALKTGRMLGTGKSCNCFSVLRNHFEHLNGADGFQQVLQLCFSC